MLVAKNLRIDDLTVEIYASEAEMALSSAEIAHNYLNFLLKQQDTATVLLATGNSQIKFLDALIGLADLDWSRINCFHLDEYLDISAEHPASFRRYLRERVEVRVQPKEFNYIEGDAEEPLKECVRYGKLLQAQPIDLCLLGIGENGHLAFNDPRVADFNDPFAVKLVKLDDINRQQQVNTGYFAEVDKVPQYAFTVTIPTICTANKIICLAPGKRKAKVVKELLYGEVTTNCPASILRKQSQATLFLDEDSVSSLILQN